MSERSHRGMTWMMAMSVAICSIVVFASLLSSFFYTRHIDIVRRHEQVASCERGNVMRIYINEIVKRTEADLKYLPVVDCEEAIS